MAVERAASVVVFGVAVLLGACGVQVAHLDMARSRAAIDLRCQKEKVETAGVSGGLVVARGCGKQGVYAVRCEDGDCAVVGDSQNPTAENAPDAPVEAAP